MARIQFYKNPHFYPDYVDVLPEGSEKYTTKMVNYTQKGGTFVVSGGRIFPHYNYVCIFDDIEKYNNYFHYWGWITDSKVLPGGLVEVSYEVDAFRTFKNSISDVEHNLQHFVRHPELSFSYDPLLNNSGLPNNAYSQLLIMEKVDKRYLVIQAKDIEARDRDLPIEFEKVRASPVTPSPYIFYIIEYDVFHPGLNPDINNLFMYLSKTKETENIVSIYSIPFVNKYQLLPDAKLVLAYSGLTEHKEIPCKKIDPYDDIDEFLTIEKEFKVPPPQGYKSSERDNRVITRVNHRLTLQTAEGAFLEIPPEALYGTYDSSIEKGQHAFKLLRQVDIFTGLVTTSLIGLKYIIRNNNPNPEFPDRKERPRLFPFTTSGGINANVPILSSEKDSYLSQNRASIVGGVLATAASAAVTGGLSLATAAPALAAGAASAIGAISGMENMNGNNSPPQSLGQNQAMTWGNAHHLTLLTHYDYEQAENVHKKYSYPANTLKKVDFSKKGYYETTSADVVFNPGELDKYPQDQTKPTIPIWAAESINSRLDKGIRIL